VAPPEQREEMRSVRPTGREAIPIDVTSDSFRVTQTPEVRIRIILKVDRF
jgi:hypothetical protein